VKRIIALAGLLVLVASAFTKDCKSEANKRAGVFVYLSLFRVDFPMYDNTL
jgi:hypothetical protein